MTGTMEAVEKTVAQEFPFSVLKSLKSLWQEECFCDVWLRVGEREFPAHRLVLAAASPYFRAMFRCGMTEGKEEHVTLHDLSPSVFEQLIHFMYSGSIQVNGENCQELLAAADMLQLLPVLTLCQQFLIQQLAADNCVGIYVLGELHQLQEVQDASERYLEQHFLQVVGEEEFRSLEWRQLVHFLHSELLQVDCEGQVLRAALRWLQHDMHARLPQVGDVLKPVRFPLIPQKDVDSMIEDIDDENLREAVTQVVQESRLDQRLGTELRLLHFRPYLLNPRKSARKYVFVLGGYCRTRGYRWTDTQTLASVEKYDTFYQHWHTVSAMKYARSSHGVAVLNRCVYVAGGESDCMIYDTVERYDPLTNTWSQVQNMVLPRYGLGLCAHGGHLYAFGGWIGAEIGNSLERYDPETNTWSMVGHMPTPRFAMGVVQHEGLVYVVGGLNDMGLEMKMMESFNPVTQEWQTLCPMGERRAHVGVAGLDKHIYVFGGWNEHEGALSSAECYSIEEDKWMELPPMMASRAGPSCIVVSGMLYVIGGRSHAGQCAAPLTLDTVECFNPLTSSWSLLPKLQTGRCEAAAFVF
ncbi:actin-binding protein IPP-like isoform X2 [Babylonia areolata]|uniref:actin-binding protein IPP-like isoform X2 n=1 Tax=Babylonia areolata TaxID=304850 RepID=UPI003FD542AB